MIIISSDSGIVSISDNYSTHKGAPGTDIS